ncbi:MAG: DMT family transporter [Neptuniibacter sp.]
MYKKANERLALYFALAAVAMWSTVATAFKVALQYMSPSQLLFYAAIFSLVLLAVVVSYYKRWNDLRHWSGRQWLYSFLMGLMNPCLYYLLLFEAYDRLPAQEAQAINYSWAIMLALLSVPFLKHKLITRDIIAGLICYTGVLVIATRGQVLSLEFTDQVGVLLALISTFVWAISWILGAKDSRDPVLGLMMNFAFAVPVLGLINLYQDNLSLPVWQGVLAAGYVGVFEMGLAFVCWLQAMRLTSHASSIGNLIFLSPFISLILIYLILGEDIYISTVSGLLMILTGVFLQRYKRSDMAG